MKHMKWGEHEVINIHIHIYTYTYMYIYSKSLRVVIFGGILFFLLLFCILQIF